MARRGTTRAFLRSVNAWTLQTEERSEQAFREGSLDFYDALRDATPVLTGNLRNSLVATTNGETSIVTGPGNDSTDRSFRSGENTSRANIMSAKIGDKISYMYTATYFRRLNYGFTGFDSLGRFYNQAGRFWVQAVGARYRSIMRAAATRLRMKMR
jgi:hypothetical protein